MRLSICLVNYNCEEYLAKCLASIGRNPPTCEYEIIVVNNSSGDASRCSMQGHSLSQLIQNTDNVGFARANNQAFACSSGDYLLMLNADTVLQEGSLDELVSCADEHPHAGLVSARLLNTDGSHQTGFNVRRLPGLGTAFTQLLMLDEFWARNPLRVRYMCLDLDYELLQPVEQPAASALLYRRTAYEDVGGFDVRFPNWYNDVDLCRRVRDANWEVLYCPSARVTHFGGMGGASRTVGSTIAETYRSQRLYYLKYFGDFGYALVSGLMVCGMALRVIALTVLPFVEGRVSTRSRKDVPAALRSAFAAVLVDTLRTWRSLPKWFENSASSCETSNRSESTDLGTTCS